MIGDRIKALRSKKGVTREALAKKLFISPQAVSRWEQGLAVPDTAILVPLADYFGVTVDYLLREKEKQPNVDYRACFDVHYEFRSAHDCPEVSAYFKNISSYSFKRVLFVVHFLDEKGEIIDYTHSYIRNLEPNTTKFDKIYALQNPHVKSAILTIKECELK